MPCRHSALTTCRSVAGAPNRLQADRACPTAARHENSILHSMRAPPPRVSPVHPPSNPSGCPRISARAACCISPLKQTLPASREVGTTGRPAGSMHNIERKGGARTHDFLVHELLEVRPALARHPGFLEAFGLAHAVLGCTWWPSGFGSLCGRCEEGRRMSGRDKAR